MLPDIHHVCRRANKSTSETCMYNKILFVQNPVWEVLRVCLCEYMREREKRETERERDKEEKQRKADNMCAPTSKGSQQDLLVEGHGALACAPHHVPHCLIDGKSGEGIRHLRRAKEESQNK